jgi:hypothetical protein
MVSFQILELEWPRLLCVTALLAALVLRLHLQSSSVGHNSATYQVPEQRLHAGIVRIFKIHNSCNY